MLSALLSMSVLTSALMISGASEAVVSVGAQSTRADFMTEAPVMSADIVEQKTAFFVSQAYGDSARVKALNSAAKPALAKACRHALTLPMRKEIKASLASKLKVELADTIDFIQADIQRFTQEYRDPWLVCRGQVTVAEPELNEAGLAIRLAWFKVKNKDKSMLRPLLAIAMKHSMTQADAVALVASQSTTQAGGQYLDKYLVANELVLADAKLAVGDIWYQQAKFQQALDLAKTCDDVRCRRLVSKAQLEIDKLEAASVDDLNSYL
ncbi:hypothetical protein [Shewanella sp. S1-49-MNA-CIBAN-0167]|uniref:hypothetical protein n=1 Tax=Shewanella sp. S1-49-MNA-CIBAN-0167 TaxID=3140468 RepID=UPI00332ED127